MKYSMDQKLKMVHEYLDNKASTLQLSKKYGYDLSKIKYMIKLYQTHGAAPFDERQADRVYTREEKLIAIRAVLSKEKSTRQVALEMAVPNPHTVQDWVRKFQQEGEDAVQPSRGRKQYMLHPDRQKYLANKEMNERLKALELENDYLKKSLALISKKNKQSKKKSKLLTNLRANTN